MAFTHDRTGRDTAGFAHRARQGLHVVRALASGAARRGEVGARPPSS